MTINTLSESSTENQLKSAKKPSALRSRIMAAIVILVVLAPMLGAYIAYHTGFGISGATVNHGDLLPQAQSTAELNFTDLDGQPISILGEQKQWRILIPASASCSDDCQKNLYTSRQVHIRLGEKARRVERVYVMPNTDISAEFKEYLSNEHPKLKLAVVELENFSALLDSDLQAGRNIYDRYYLMDQEGFIMMSYGVEHTGNDLLADIKRMLKYSYAE